uniref:Uncharacterized protein n=1 Tax=Amphimedon queenslandica TaxID=400682 RepID=A0A1X7T5H6_AMPQE
MNGLIQSSWKHCKGTKPCFNFCQGSVFITNYAEVLGISLPGRIPGMKSYEHKKFLPCSTSKRQVCLEYAESCERLYVIECAEITFNMLWRH